MKGIVLFAILTVFGSGVSAGQSKKAMELGTVKVSVRSISYKWADPKDIGERYEILITNGSFTRKVPYLERSLQRDENGNIIYHTDEYKIRLRKGVYRLIIQGVKNYRLANFRVGTGETVNFNIPQDMFAWDEICNGDSRILMMFDSEESYRAQLRKYSRPPYRKIRREVFVLEKPFEMVVRYCGLEKRGTVLRYKDAQVYYKNYYIEAPLLILRKDKMQIEAIAREKSADRDYYPAYIEINGNKTIESGTLIFDLRTGQILNR